MAEDTKDQERRASGEPEAGDEVEIEIDAEEDDLERTMREAVEAVERTEADHGEGGGPAGAGVVDIEQMEREIQDLRDRSMRTLADFDNFRKRAERERTEIKRYALVEPMRDLLEVVDNLERALGAGGSADDLKQGVEMIVRQLGDLLRRHGVQAVEADGQPFDPAVHEAVSRHDSPDVSEPTVAQVFQKGYRIHDRLLRPAMVSVAVPERS